MFASKEQLYTHLKIFLIIICALMVIGLLFIYSSSSVFALAHYGSASYFVKKQMIGIFLGSIALCVAALVPLELVRRASPLFFIGSLMLTCTTLIPSFGQRIHGSSRWIYIGGFSFQPSELLKISLILYIAYFLSKKELQLGQFWRGYFPFLTILGITSMVLLRQPDFGMTVTLVATAFILFFIVHFKPKHALLTLAAGAPILGFLILFKPYRLKRIMTFLNPWQDPQGAGFQIIQSLIAIGSGNWFGIGVSHSKQKYFYLPMQHTDFIFSIIAEETGLMGSGLLILLYMLFLYFGMKIAWQLKDNYCIFLTLGFVILTSLQTIINLCVVTGLLPTKGIGLPFVSYGNSSLMCSLLMVGLIINCVRESEYYSYARA